MTTTEALLREALDMLRVALPWPGTHDKTDALIARIDAALTAAPVAAPPMTAPYDDAMSRRIWLQEPVAGPLSARVDRGKDRYDLTHENGAIKVYRNGEFVIGVDLSTAPVAAPAWTHQAKLQALFDFVDNCPNDQFSLDHVYDELKEMLAPTKETT